MKSSARQTSPGRIPGRLAVLLLLTVLVSSCATPRSQLRTEPTGSSRMAPAITNRWVKVRVNPPTWYPRGTRADCPTDHRSGEWIRTEDALGTLYFIPLHGMAKDQRKSLLKEALATRSPGKVRRIAREDTQQQLQQSALFLFGLTPPGWVYFLRQADSPSATGEPTTEKDQYSGGFGGFGGMNFNPSIHCGSIGNIGGGGGCGGGGGGGR
jgi:hypothetical protein